MARQARRRIEALVRALTLAAALAAPAAARAEAMPAPGLLAAVAAWVATVTGLPMPAAPPAVALSEPGEMALLRLGEGAEAAGAVRIVALYDTERRRIHLPRGWTGATPAEMSVLVHEMVHHLQTTSDVRYACPAEREKAAYDAQAAWLELFGEDLAGAFDIDPMTRLVLTTCGM